MEKLRLSSKKQQNVASQTTQKCFLEQKGMTCNHTLQGSRFRTVPFAWGLSFVVFKKRGVLLTPLQQFVYLVSRHLLAAAGSDEASVGGGTDHPIFGKQAAATAWLNANLPNYIRSFLPVII